MLQILQTIAPIFIVTFLGAVLRRIRLMPDYFLGPANQVVYYVAIPAMVFRKIATNSFEANFEPLVLGGIVTAIVVMVVLGLLIARFLPIAPNARPTFAQTAFHGNLGYIGLAVAFYALGNDGLVKASILTGFLMIIQNLLSVMILTRNLTGDGRSRFQPKLWFGKIVVHPVVMTALAGILFSLSGLKLPVIVDRSLAILDGMSLPLALLLIGASMSVKQFRGEIRLTMISAALKLLLLPALGLIMFRMMDLSPDAYLPGIILLAAPSATMSYIMAKEMNGDPELGAACISSSVVLCALSYTFWLAVTG
jgi:predicted permease